MRSPLARLSRRRFVQGFGVSVAAPFAAAGAPSDSRSLAFVAVGDWGRDGQFLQAEVAQRMGEAAAELSARFVVSVGDNFYERGVASAEDLKWKTSFEDVYTAPSLQVPWYVALGNHDYYGDVEAQLAYAKTSPRWRMPSRWYGFAETGQNGVAADFFVIDTTPMIADYRARQDVLPKVEGQDVPAQLAWLDRALGASRADWKIVIGHHPIYAGDNSQAGPEAKWGSPDLVAKVDPLLQRHGVQLYLYGHDHELEHTARGATHYVCTGAGSKTEHACNTAGVDFCSLQSGFISCVVRREMAEITYCDHAGVALHVVDVARSG
jgi:acid phosphatase